MAWLKLPSISAASRFLLNEYFLLNVAILASYYLFRVNHTHRTVDISLPYSGGKTNTFREFAVLHSSGYTQLEAQIAATLTLTAVMRSYRSSSFDATVATILGFCQLFVIMTAALTDMVAAAWYLAAFGVVFLLFNEPSYDGDSKIEVMTAHAFMDKCLKDTGDGVTYAVFMQTTWSSRCRHAYPLFAELSLRYATDKLRFARLDVGTWPRLASTLNIDLSSTSAQLPTVACYEAGQETGRVPVGNKNTLTGVGKWTFSKVELINSLKLDALYARSMGTGAESSGTAAAS